MVTVENDGSLTFRVYLPHAQRVELVADFTHWGEGRIPLTREQRLSGEMDGAAPEEAETMTATSEEGWWVVCTTAPDGDHAFSYLIDDQWWLPDYAAHGVRRNAEGHWTSLLFVPPKPQLVERISRRRAVLRSLRQSA
jgi:1,4-alpha-glucan branching enzyme